MNALNPRGRLAVLSTGVAALAIPAAVPAATGAQEPAPEQGGEQQSAPRMQAVKARKHARIGTSVPVKGRLSTGESGKRVVVERRSRHGWKRVADARTREGGNFSARWKTRNVGRFAVRVKAIASPESTARVRGKVTVYRPGAASYYGPGLYGNKLACGGTLQPGTLGVAHKTLPCGTRVTFRYRGRSVAVRVIDRGPYVGGREWDLTEATRNRLRFPSTGTVWSSR